MKKKSVIQTYAEKEIRMRASEKRLLKERVLSFMEYHPLSLAAADRVSVSRKIFAYTEGLYARAVLGVAAVVLIIGVPFAAELSLPGDTLYPVKVRFNEEILSTLSLSPYQKVVWETKRVERRIAEARLLASEGRLTEETEEEIEETVKNHTDNAQKEIDSLRESDIEGAELAQITLSSALDVQSAVLESDVDASEGEQSEGKSVEGIRDAVRLAQEGVDQKGSATTTISFARLSEQVNDELESVYLLFESVSEAASNEEREEIATRIRQVEKALEDADLERTSGGEGAGAQLLRAALLDVQKLAVFMSDIDLRSSVSLDRLVPQRDIKDAERFDAVTHILDEASAFYDLRLGELDTITDENEQGEMRVALNDLSRLVEDAAFMLVQGQLESAELLGEDIKVLLGGFEVKTEDEEVVDLEGETVTEEASSEEEVDTQ